MIIVIIVLVFVLGSGGTIFWLLILSALNKKSKNAPVVHAETMRGIPDTPELTEAELTKKLRSLKVWSMILKRSFPIFIVAGFAVCAYLATQQAKITGVTIAVAAVAVVLLLGLNLMAFDRSRKLKDIMGAAVTLPVLREIFEVKAYRPNEHLWRDLIHSTGLISSWKEISGSDYTEGSYRGINFLFSDLHLEHTEKEDKHTHRVTDFKGQWLVCDFSRELSATLRLRERKSGDGFWGTHNVSKSDIETENIEFNKKYQIITEDEQSAFYLLTPHFMERLVALDAMAGAQTFFCFMDGKVHIALYNWRDSFELSGIKPEDMDGLREKFRGDLKYMTDIMDALLLNDRLFKSEEIT